jgi:nucleosome binding factor SPN SPT16 subunit
LQPFQDPDATFIRSVSYRSPDGHRFDNICKQITDLKKEANKREQQKKEMADVIEQGSLVELKGRRPIKMSEAFVRPALDGKRLPGEVEIHQNGVRYQSPLGSQKIGEHLNFLTSKQTYIKLQTSFSAMSSIFSSNHAITSYWSSSICTSKHRL